MTVADLEERLGNVCELTEWAAYFRILNEEREKEEKKQRQQSRASLR